MQLWGKARGRVAKWRVVQKRLLKRSGELGHSLGMFLRRHRRAINGECYDYWTLVRTVRTAAGPRQEIVATLGKEPGLESRSRHGWENVADLLEGRAPAPSQGELGRTVTSPSPQWAQVDVGGVRVEGVRDFGQIYLALSLWRRLGLHTLLAELMESGREEVSWELAACVLTVARFCGQKSELEVAERWYADSALEDLLGVPVCQINPSRLYRALDILQGHKDDLCAHLQVRYQSWFGVEFEFLLYDVTSTYFEGQALGNAKAKRGYSRDQRPDCKQVNIGLVVTPEGLPIGYEVFAGNTADVTTVEEIVRLMEEKYGRAKRIWILDRGMISHENIDFLRERGACYIVGTPKSQLKGLAIGLLEEQDWTEVQPGVEVKLVEHPDGGDERYILCRSSARRQKEAAMIQLQRQRLRERLDETHATLQRHPAKDAGKIERRIGRWLGRFPAAERLLEISVQRDAQGRACRFRTSVNAVTGPPGPNAPTALTCCALTARKKTPPNSWRWYMQLTQAEDAYRISKSDLRLRPVFHQKTERVQAHILVCFLSLALWRTLEQWMHGKGLGNCALIAIGGVHRAQPGCDPAGQRNRKQPNSRITSPCRRPPRIVPSLNCWSGWVWTCRKHPKSYKM